MILALIGSHWFTFYPPFIADVDPEVQREPRPEDQLIREGRGAGPGPH